MAIRQWIRNQWEGFLDFRQEDFKLAADLFVVCRGQGYMGFRDRETLAGILGIKGIMGMDPWELEHWLHASAKGLAK